jgi:uncharacterized protein (DUF1800 family)
MPDARKEPPMLEAPRIRTLTVVLVAAALTAGAAGRGRTHLPWKEAGLTERQAAAHLLDRFTFGPRPGEVDEVVAMGLDAWLDRQLAAGLPDRDLDRRLSRFRTLELPLSEIVRTYPGPGLVLLEARAAGRIPKDMDPRSQAGGATAGDAMGEGVVKGGEPDFAAMDPGAGDPGDPGDAVNLGAADAETAGDPEYQALRRDLIRYAMEKGYRSQRELIGEMMAAKLYRAVYSDNQLTEVLTDFWYNHFFVSLADNETRSYAMAYERDAIRPHVLGDFRTLLGATAHHPAMLLYLDNARSVAVEGAPTTLDRQLARMRLGGPAGFGRGGFGRDRFGRPAGGGRFGGGRARRGPDSGEAEISDEIHRLAPEFVRPQGINENYARELLELHTLGVDGGYTQQDVIEVARAFTGWTVLPPGPLRQMASERLARVRRAGGSGARGWGFVVDGEFLFRADAHDAGAKHVLGTTLPAGRGIEDGEAVLDLLARHPATAHHLARKLAVRFVSDDPPAGLVDRLAATWEATGGDLRAVVRAIAESPEFWAPEARRSKIKSPFALAVSALRALDADVEQPRETLGWIARMGEPPYFYQAPTGYPDSGESWVNTGSLLARMNFGLQLAAGRVAGVSFDLAALDGGREPPSREDALTTYLALLMPERDHAATVARLLAVASDPRLPRRVAEAAPDEGAEDPFSRYFGDRGRQERDGPPPGRLLAERRRPGTVRYPEPSPLEQVVGVILGSPEFQRR